MNWNDPNQVAIFAAWGQWAGAISSSLAVIVAFIAIWMGRKQFKEDWKRTIDHAEKERQLQLRPIIVPIDTHLHGKSDGQLHWELCYTSDGMGGSSTYTDQNITLQNIGGGAAFNVHSFLYGPHPVLNHQVGSWYNGPIQGNTSLRVRYTNDQTNLGKQTKVDGTHLLYDDSDSSHVARLTTTYQDISGFKHVSIFDYVLLAPRNYQWMYIDTAVVQNDLKDLENNPAPTSTKHKLSK